MNINLKIVFVLFLACAVFCLASCAKKRAADTAYAKLVGKWKLVKTGSDDNVNGTIEERETHAVSTRIKQQTTFSADGSGITSSTFDTTKSPDLRFRWHIVNGDSVEVAYAANDTLTYFLVNITAKELTMTTLGRIGLEWYLYTKE